MNLEKALARVKVLEVQLSDTTSLLEKEIEAHTKAKEEILALQEKISALEARSVGVTERSENMTNGDYIRAKNDEEFARWMMNYQLVIVENVLQKLGTNEHLATFKEAVGVNPDFSDLLRFVKAPYQSCSE